MISAPAPFVAANASLQKKPCWLFKIAGYDKAFSNCDLGEVSGLPPDFAVIQQAQRLADFGGLEAFESTVTMADAIRAGDILFAFGGGGVGAVGSVTDTAGNNYINLYTSVGIKVWYAVANASVPAGNVVSFNGESPGFINGGNFELFVIEAPSNAAGFAYTGASGTGNISISAGGFSIFVPYGGSWNVFLLSLPGGQHWVFGSTALPAFTGYGVSNITAGPGYAVVSVTGPATVYPWLVNLDPLSLTISDLDGGADFSELAVTVQDHRQGITMDFPHFIFEGKRCALFMGFDSISPDDFAQLYTARVDYVASVNDNNEYAFNCIDPRVELNEVIFQFGDSGLPTDDKNPKSLIAHPLDILLDALDQAGVAATDIDLTKIQSYRDGVYAGLEFAFSLTSPPACKDFIEAEIMKPLGAYLWTNNLGQVSVNFFYPANLAPVATLDNDNLIEVPQAAQADLINQVAVRFDKEDSSGTSGGFLAESIQTAGISVQKFGIFGEQVIESAGMRSGFQGFFLAELTSFLIFSRYAEKPLLIDKATAIWSLFLAEPGDLIALTSSLVPDRKNGIMGVTGQLFEILDRDWDFMACTVALKLLAVDFDKFKRYLITPNGEANYAAASSGDKALYMFQCNDSDKYSNSDPAHTLG